MGAKAGVTRPRWFAPHPEDYARSAVATVGVQDTTYGYFYHTCQVIVSDSHMMYIKSHIQSYKLVKF